MSGLFTPMYSMSSRTSWGRLYRAARLNPQQFGSSHGVESDCLKHALTSRPSVGAGTHP